MPPVPDSELPLHVVLDNKFTEAFDEPVAARVNAQFLDGILLKEVEKPRGVAKRIQGRGETKSQEVTLSSRKSALWEFMHRYTNAAYSSRESATQAFASQRKNPDTVYTTQDPQGYLREIARSREIGGTDALLVFYTDRAHEQLDKLCNRTRHDLKLPLDRALDSREIAEYLSGKEGDAQMGYIAHSILSVYTVARLVQDPPDETFWRDVFSSREV